MYLISNLAQYFQLSFSKHRFLPSVMTKLAIVCAYVFGKEWMRKMFRLKQGATKFECQVYQREIIPEPCYMVQEQSEKVRNQTTYRKSVSRVVLIWIMWILPEENFRSIDEDCYNIHIIFISIWRSGWSLVMGKRHLGGLSYAYSKLELYQILWESGKEGFTKSSN